MQAVEHLFQRCPSSWNPQPDLWKLNISTFILWMTWPSKLQTPKGIYETFSFLLEPLRQIGSSPTENSEMSRLPSEALVQVFLGSWNFSMFSPFLTPPFSPSHSFAGFGAEDVGTFINVHVQPPFAERNANVRLQISCRIKCFGKSNISAI